MQKVPESDNLKFKYKIPHTKCGYRDEYFSLAMATTYANAAAIRAFRIVEILAQAREPLTLTEIVEQIELPKQTVHRLLGQLEGASVIVRHSTDKRYECSARMRNMALSLLMTAGPGAARHAILLELADQLGETCNLSMPSGTDMVYLDRIQTNWPLQFVLHAGSRVPFHCTASGKLYLSLLPKAQRERLIRQLPLRSSTPNTITDVGTLRDELEQIRRQRYAINNGEFMPNMTAIAAPVMLTPRRQCAAIAIQGPSQRLSLERLLEMLPLLQQAADRMAETFR